MSGKGGKGRRHLGTIHLLSRGCELGVGRYFTIPEIAVRPAIVQPLAGVQQIVVKRSHGLVGRIVSQMIGAHVGDKESAIDEAKTNRVAQP